MLHRFSAVQIEEFLILGNVHECINEAFAEYDLDEHETALTRCHVSCDTRIGIFLMVSFKIFSKCIHSFIHDTLQMYEVSKVLAVMVDAMEQNTDVANKLIAARNSIAFVTAPHLQAFLNGDAHIAVAELPPTWLISTRTKSGQMMRTLPHWFIEDPRAVQLFALSKFQAEITRLGALVTPPKDKLSQFGNTDLCISILSSPLGLALYRDTDFLPFEALYRLGSTQGLLANIRKYVNGLL